MPKTIFGTTEKSNFILNMKPETLQKWIHGVLACCIVIPLIGAAVLSLMAKINYISAAMLYATSFTCILFFLIVMLRKDMKFSDNKSYILIIALAVMAVVSYYSVLGNETSYIKTAILGNIGRYEGLLSILSYLGIFLLATAVTKISTMERMLDLLVGAGAFEAAAALFQHLPFDYNPSYYETGSTMGYRDLPTIAYQNVFLSSGLTGSPIFYGAITTLTGTLALAGAIYGTSKRRSRLYGAAALFIFLTGMFTGSVVPLIGEAAAALVILVLCIVDSAKGGEKKTLVRTLIMVGAMAVTFIIVWLTQGFYLRDRMIAFYDSFYRLFITNVTTITDHGKGNIPYTVDFWKEQWKIAIDTANAHPLTGVGADCLATYYGMQANYNDKCYNEFLYIAATRGYISMVLYAALIVMTAVHLCRGMKEFFADRSKWYIPCLLAVVTAYTVQSFFNASAITTAPFFWLTLGISWSAVGTPPRVFRDTAR